MTLLHRNPNRLARRERAAALLAEAAGTTAVGDIVRIVRDGGGVDLVRVIDAFTSPASGIRMITVRTHPYGIQSTTVRADAVVPDDAPDVRHDAVDCAADPGGPCELHRVERAAAGDNEREG